MNTRIERRRLSIAGLVAAFLAIPAAAQVQVLDPGLHHLRVGGEREWSDFPAKSEGPTLTLRFQAQPNPGEWTLRLRQQDVRQAWKVILNGKELHRLPPDENDMVLYVPIPAGWITAGENTLLISQAGKIPDDVRIGEISLQKRPVSEALSEAAVEITVHDPMNLAIPCRLTVLNAEGALMTVGAQSGGHLAVRPGVIYTGTGRAKFGLPAGEYTIYAGRGFAHGLDSVRVTLKPGDVFKKSLTLRREVPANGYISCDTHVHTLTYSGHGDSSLDERMLTLAGENIELPIATDHNRQIDFETAAVKMGVRHYFTPVVGNEVTTALGHFNIFPAPAQVGEGPRIPNYKAKDWPSIFGSIAERTAAKVIILNHPHDLHGGYRPFGPKHHNHVSGENLDGWDLRANAMEVVNSGAHQTDVMRPFHDWMHMLNRGNFLTPVGASDSHDVSRYIVGQGRTYIRSRSTDPGKIDTDEAVANFVQGKVLVSCGLLTDITVNGKFGPGDLVPQGKDGNLHVKVRRAGPWLGAGRQGRTVRQRQQDPGSEDRAGAKDAGQVGRRVDLAALWSRHAPGCHCHRPGRAGAVLADQQALSGNLAAGQSPHYRRHRRRLVGRGRRRQQNLCLRIRQTTAQDLGTAGSGQNTEAHTFSGGIRRSRRDPGCQLAASAEDLRGRSCHSAGSRQSRGPRRTRLPGLFRGMARMPDRPWRHQVRMTGRSKPHG